MRRKPRRLPKAPAGAGADTHRPSDMRGRMPARRHGAFPPFDPSTFPSQILWLAITFGLFYLFLKRVVLPRIGGILEVRRDRIAQDLDQAATHEGRGRRRRRRLRAGTGRSQGQGQRHRPAGPRRPPRRRPRPSARRSRPRSRRSLPRPKPASPRSRPRPCRKSARSPRTPPPRSSSSWSAARSTRPTIAAAVKSVAGVAHGRTWTRHSGRPSPSSSSSASSSTSRCRA